MRSLVVSCLCIGASGAWAAATDYGDLHWRLLGPFRGGRVLTVADLRTEVYNFWDRGLLGLAIDPGFGTTVIAELVKR